MPDLSSIWWWVTYIQIKFCKNKLMMTTWMKGRMNTMFWLNTDLITMFGWDVKIRSIHEEEFGNICVGSLIIWCNASCEATFSILLPSKLVLLLLYQFQYLSLKLPITANRKGFFCARSSNVISKLLAKV